jgi:hypothetical protein
MWWKSPNLDKPRGSEKFNNNSKFQASLLKTEKEAPVGAEMLLPISRERRFSIDLISSSLEMSLTFDVSRKLLASNSACRKLGG